VKANADRFAKNVLPVVRDMQSNGVIQVIDKVLLPG